MSEHVYLVMDYGADEKYFSYEYPSPTMYSLRCLCRPIAISPI